ncbi:MULTISPECIES: carboxymuconolactone decarboxylase family protein [Gordonia]|uniref:Carboxymuconolactone decarboxylase family protein n=1 Tax=Gordonia amicalis TaxID=89053 RepID=A0AAE4U9U4_9ACTN|nr:MULTISPECIES: carboxymuconolactone decarboxylase family protein [Gordonia]ATD69325.1 carboxymuconolactone decarboxylase family protein [Gordonia sp. 1D]MBA5846054.1 carboxymuconolactone decarboxylase family protein [Gordonia amicalis]MCZ4581308.1 carboxymuconolactone decarboxylase family protein [Gordonia amicalis]MDJ0451956.1 carboxymuconolactone decarboxylase family protein [Gordonia amicalis]MDV6308011.1 carboxymuconolactone decarboxylase family protein [Gordonia amicalis]
MGYGKDVQQELRAPARALRQAIPQIYESFGQLYAASLTAGALDAKTKELISLAIAVSTQCDGCIAAHARGAAIQGSTPQEAAEAIGVAIMMAGGPATVYGPRAFAAFNEFHAERASSSENAAPGP